jgi:hypothetical protein
MEWNENRLPGPGPVARPSMQNSKRLDPRELGHAPAVPGRRSKRARPGRPLLGTAGGGRRGVEMLS